MASDETRLWQDYARQPSARQREKLFVFYFGFAKGMAARIWRDRSRGDVELAELSQLAAAGLLEAIDHFDPNRGVPFRGYAARRIRGSVLDGLSKMSDAREQMSLAHRIRSERMRSIAEGRREPRSASEALEALIEATVGLAIGFMLEGTTLYVADEAAASSRMPNAYESLAWKELVQRLMGEVGRLPEREQQIVRLHYLNGLTFDQIGEMIGVTKGRISQIHREAMTRLRRELGQSGHFRLER